MDDPLAERRFVDVWSRPELSDRDRRLVLVGLLVAQGLDDELEIQLDAALRTGDLTPGELRAVVALVVHYAGASRGARLDRQAQDLIERTARG
ncbi:carboxymuconolactone decarboxylase family protein [Nonomuraea soli]|uniref:4-carboxymuconolactone decarboxylase n=1 Tax=Nonomuraea soli TaxID=1032476 RepID=A0A7W0CP50_9ACTN|nr:carboxymuconolactone decarboxylase family protein [Nonomuraea soli]MBA2894736.1 4-carboxymuconolactone decarboxylase [Nonomuraea soli]